MTKRKSSRGHSPPALSGQDESLASSSKTAKSSEEAEEKAESSGLPMRWVYGSDPTDRANFGYMKLVPVERTDLAVSIPVLPEVPLDIIVPTFVRGPRVLKATLPSKPNTSNLSRATGNHESQLVLSSPGLEFEPVGRRSVSRGTDHHQLSYRRSPLQPGPTYPTPESSSGASW